MTSFLMNYEGNQGNLLITKINKRIKVSVDIKMNNYKSKTSFKAPRDRRPGLTIHLSEIRCYK